MSIYIRPLPLRTVTDASLPLTTTDRLAIMNARLACGECGSLDGMQDWAWWNVQAVLEDERYWRPAQFYRRTGLGELFAPCPTCNPWGDVPEGYEAVTWEEVVAFAEEGIE